MSTSVVARVARAIVGTAVGLSIFGVADLVWAQQLRPGAGETRRGAAAVESQELDVLPVQRDVYLIAGAGSNIAVHVGFQGLVVVDTGEGSKTDQVIQALQRLSDKPIRYIINTSGDPRHVGGTAALAKAGRAIPSREVHEEGAVIVAHENVLMRMSAPTGQEPPYPLEFWPTETYFVPQKDLYVNGQAVQVMHQPAAHTEGDSLVFFRSSDVVCAGDIFTPDSYPVIDRATGGSIQGVIDALNRLLDITVPADKAQGGTLVIPGHGRISDETDVVDYRDMVTIIRDRIADLVKKGYTLEQVHAARVTRDYDHRYGAETGPWTTAMFVEAVYRDLTRGGTE